MRTTGLPDGVTSGALHGAVAAILLIALLLEFNVNSIGLVISRSNHPVLIVAMLAGLLVPLFAVAAGMIALGNDGDASGGIDG